MSEIIEYKPERLDTSLKMPAVHTAWNGLEQVLPGIVERFCIKREHAIEFGVWYGYSTAALAQCFAAVLGVDTFEGDDDAGRPSDLLESASSTLAAWPNVTLLKAHYFYFIHYLGQRTADLIHIDISHDYASTHELGRWSCAHSPVVIFHDTESFSTVKQAVSDLADETGRKFYNYPFCNGLGILV